ncbi:hemerythrin domain-containing protein [Acidiferrimicrobium sp. IK]|uniref:hemerythrin domain-containing protein n=1 Tax=Acidiferrimicrobium sp. IK TaxID=2871700 RepID=UPI0021CB3EA7|nr:hemerythrin domain-containing protein [Acidiferrimicrobium sp. IK]MCU4185259.1 hemerythrin domain-containing protein [Acidiferrimicrobium sp. IK]
MAPIRELSEEHDAIGVIAARVRRAIGDGDHAAAGAELRQLQAALAPHLQREEAGIFAQLAARDGFAWYLSTLMADHASARADLLGVDPDGAGWDGRVLAGLDALAEHISLEEYDLFPASRMMIDDHGWAEVIAAHERLRHAAAAPAGR